MSTSTACWAYLFEHPGADPARDRLVLDSGGQRSLILAVASTADAPAVAAGLVRDEHVTLIELCGGFGSGDVAAVAAAVGEHAAVGHVVFGVDQIPAAAAYATAATAALSAAASTPDASSSPAPGRR